MTTGAFFSPSTFYTYYTDTCNQGLTRGSAATGKFKWSASNFSQAASDVDLQLEGPTHEPILRAQLNDGDGDMHDACVNLADCVKNENGELHFMDCF